MQIQQTSLSSYKEIQPYLKGHQEEIYNIIKKYSQNYKGLTDYEIATLLNKKDPNYVRPRRNELVRLNCIECKGKRQCTITGKSAMIWGLK